MTQELHGVISLGGTVIGGSLYQRGLKGETGVGIESVVMTANYDLIITYTDESVETVPTGLDTYKALLEGYKSDTYSYMQGAINSASSAYSSAQSASGSASDAATYRGQAYNYATSAQTAQTAAETAQGKAETAQEAAETAQGLAETAQGAAETAQGKAETAQGKAETAQGKAEDAQLSAEGFSMLAEDASLMSKTYQLKSEGYALGEQNGEPVDTDSPYYENNSKYYSEQSADSAEDADASALVSEGFAVGEQNGTPVTSGSPYYHNNAKYYSEQFIRAFPTDTASGAIASFEDGSDLFDYLSCIVDIDPVQDLHGYDKPWVGGAGVNKWDEDWEAGAIANSNGQNSSLADTIRSKGYIPVSPSTQYYVKTPTFVYIRFYDSNKDYLGSDKSIQNISSSAFTTPSGASYMRFYAPISGSVYGNNIAINYPSSVTTYSPWENLCPITGWTGCEVDVVGKNLFDIGELVELGTGVSEITNGYRFSVSGAMFSTGVSFKKPFANPVTISMDVGNISGTNLRFRVVHTDGTENEPAGSGTGSGGHVTLTTTKPIKGIKFNWSSAGIFEVTNFQIEFGSTETAYTPYNGTTYPVSWQTEAGTVYGGKLHIAIVNGEPKTWVTVTHILQSISSVTLYGNYGDDNAPLFYADVSTSILSYPYNWYPDKNKPKSDRYIATTAATVTGLKNGEIRTKDAGTQTSPTDRIYIRDDRFTSATDFNAEISLSPIQILGTLSTPTTYQLDPVQVACLLGQNNVFANCGNIEEVKYKADVQKYIDKKTEELSVAILALS